MEQKVIEVFSNGKGGCEHDYVYDKPVKMSFTFPPVIEQLRICECCGKAELVSESEVFGFDADKIKKLMVQFGKKK